MGRVVILTGTAGGAKACASAARISTTGGGAVEQYEKAEGGRKDIALMKKVLSSGHQTIYEHQTYFVAFENVSVAVEQFVIEARLGSYTVKSRRYVDFSGAGYVTPEDLTPEQKGVYQRRMDRLFALYAHMLDKGVSREDARFVLPYCFCSNFYMTMNARELAHLAGSMARGRGACQSEIRALGESLMEQVEKDWPGVTELILREGRKTDDFDEQRIAAAPAFQPARPRAQLIFAEDRAEEKLRSLMAFGGREQMDFASLVRDERPRELEFLNYGYHIHDVSLACLTHFARHRIQTLLAPDLRTALTASRYIVPDCLRKEEDLLAEYAAAFEETRKDCLALLETGMPKAYAAYFLMAGMTLPIRVMMNAREMAHFFRLRTCERAQWEIRRLAEEMLSQAAETAPNLFASYGPSCRILGKCPEGRLSCGHPRYE